MYINNKNEIINEFKKLIASQLTVSKLIENKNIFIKKNIVPLYDLLKSLPINEKKNVGLEINSLNKELMNLFLNRKTELENYLDNSSNKLNYCLYVDTYKLDKGSKSILSIVIDKIINYFKRLNFQIIEGDEVTTIENNMDRLNIDKNHPARDAKDTFYIDAKKMLRTHCTATTAQVIHNNDNELKVLSYGNVYRNDDDDLTHSHQFNQVDIV
jgi:phenylalanyl-tRNA synthetase alpha chain